MKVFIFAVLIAAVAANSPYSGSYGSDYRKENYGTQYENKAYGGDQSYNKNQYAGYENNYGYEKNYAPMPYNYYYNVKDDYTYTDFSAQQQSDEKGHVTGSYSTNLPDGRIQTVIYKADDYGYTAEVKYEGEAKYPEYNAAYKINNKPAYQAQTYPAEYAYGQPYPPMKKNYYPESY